MAWDAETQRRSDSLRERQLNGELSAEEQHELDALLAALDAEEASYLTPAIERMGQELHYPEARLAALQIRNEELAARARQHEQLLSEAASWLEQFDQRRLMLQDPYAPHGRAAADRARLMSAAPELRAGIRERYPPFQEPPLRGPTRQQRRRLGQTPRNHVAPDPAPGAHRR